jgi:hypothetical protein
LERDIPTRRLKVFGLKVGVSQMPANRLPKPLPAAEVDLLFEVACGGCAAS